MQRGTERSYPTSEVRGRSREDPMPEGWRPRGATPLLRSGAAARRSYPTSKVGGSSLEELPCVQGYGLQSGGAAPHLRPGAAARRSDPISKERWLRRHQRA